MLCLDSMTYSGRGLESLLATSTTLSLCCKGTTCDGQHKTHATPTREEFKQHVIKGYHTTLYHRYLNRYLIFMLSPSLPLPPPPPLPRLGLKRLANANIGCVSLLSWQFCPGEGGGSRSRAASTRSNYSVATDL